MEPQRRRTGPWLLVAALIVVRASVLFFVCAPASTPGRAPAVGSRSGAVSDDSRSRCPTAAFARCPPGTTGAPARRVDRAGARAGGARGQGERRSPGSRPAARGGRDGRDPDRARSRGARAAAPLGGAHPGHGGARALSRAPASASARRSRTASTTTSRCAAVHARRSRAIEAEMAEVAPRDYPFVREVVDRDRGQPRFADDPLKLERIGELGDRRDHHGLHRRAVRRPLPGPARARAPAGSSTSSCCTPPARTGAATSGGRCSSASTARRGSRRRTSTRTSTGSRRRSKRDHRVLGKAARSVLHPGARGPGPDLLAPQGRARSSGC